MSTVSPHLWNALPYIAVIGLLVAIKGAGIPKSCWNSAKKMTKTHIHDPIFDNVQIANLNIQNRIFRAATSETAAEKNGDVSDRLIEFYSRIAKGQPGLIFTGHMFVETEGQYAPFRRE